MAYGKTRVLTTRLHTQTVTLHDHQNDRSALKELVKSYLIEATTE